MEGFTNTISVRTLAVRLEGKGMEGEKEKKQRQPIMLYKTNTRVDMSHSG
jgi:hypothetical protein